MPLTVPEEFAGFANVRGMFRPQSHQSSYRGMGCHSIVANDDPAEFSGFVVQWAITFHGHDSVGNDPVDWNRRFSVD